MDRPNYVKCVRKYNDQSLTWCGNTIKENSDWVFTDANHAILHAYKNGKGGSLLICSQCVEELVYYLEATF